MDRGYQRENLKWHLMKHPMMSAFCQGWGMPSGTSVDGLSCFWDKWGRHKGCCTASVQSRSPLASCSCCLALMAGVFHGWTCRMSLALCCSTLHLPADEVGHFLLFQKLIPHVCAAGRLCHTWWATFLVCLSNPWPLRAAGQRCCPWGLLQGNPGKFPGLYSFTL